MSVVQEPKDVVTPQNVKAAALEVADHLFLDPWTRKDAARFHN